MKRFYKISILAVLCVVATVHPMSVWDSLRIRNIPEYFQANVEEEVSQSMHNAKAEWLCVSSGYGDTSYLYYQKSPLNPKKEVAAFSGWNHVWTRDSLDGRLRKLAVYKFKEPINGTALRFMDIFPWILSTPNPRVIEDAVLDTTSRRLIVEMKNMANLFLALTFGTEDGRLRTLRFQTPYGTPIREIRIEARNEVLETELWWETVRVKDFRKGTETVQHWQPAMEKIAMPSPLSQ